MTNLLYCQDSLQAGHAHPLTASTTTKCHMPHGWHPRKLAHFRNLVSCKHHPSEEIAITPAGSRFVHWKSARTHTRVSAAVNCCPTASRMRQTASAHQRTPVHMHTRKDVHSHPLRQQMLKQADDDGKPMCICPYKCQACTPGGSSSVRQLRARISASGKPEPAAMPSNSSTRWGSRVLMGPAKAKARVFACTARPVLHWAVS